MTHYRTFVWHAGHMDEAKAKELEEEIALKQKRLEQTQFHQCMGTSQQLASVKAEQEELKALHEEYEKLTGEVYEARGNTDSTRSATTAASKKESEN